MKASKIQFKVHSVRTMVSPYKTGSGENSSITLYYLLANMKDIPDNIPLDVNPRKPKMTTNVAKSLKKAVIETENDFYINNRGIVIAAKDFSFNTSESVVSIDLGDQEDESDHYSYGILDGGHTYTAILEMRDKIPAGKDQYVRLEVITNVDNITRLSDARNTSVQVSDIALFNLDDKFDYIKDSIKDQPYSSMIAYKDNEDKPINVSELLRLMYAFDLDMYPDDTSAPIQSYTSKQTVFNRYKKAFDSDLYKALTMELPTLVNLYDTIEVEMAIKYSEYKKALGTIGRFGAVRGIDTIDNDYGKSTYLNTVKTHNVSTGFIFPIFGAFRSLVSFDEVNKIISWKYDPISIWKEIGVSLVQNTFETQTNPQLAGKDKQLWLSNYRIVETQCLRKLLTERM